MAAPSLVDGCRLHTNVTLFHTKSDCKALVIIYKYKTRFHEESVSSQYVFYYLGYHIVLLCCPRSGIERYFPPNITAKKVGKIGISYKVNGKHLALIG